MQLEHSFTLPAGVDQTWRILSDIGSIAALMPGSALDEVSAGSAEGALKVKLGPLNLTYRGRAELVESDVSAHRAVVVAHGVDARNGSADATVTATLRPDGAGTGVDLVTDLVVTGKPAQFTRSVMIDFGAKLVGQFAAALAAAIDTDQPEAAAAPATPPVPSEPAAPADPAPEPAHPAAEPAHPAAVPADPAAVSVNGHGTSAPRTPATAEPAGPARPAIVKGLAPVALAALLLLGAARRRRSRRA